jgi:beta-galactosidase
MKLLKTTNGLFFACLFMFIFLPSCQPSLDSLREKISFNSGWKFALIDDANASLSDYNDDAWRKLDVPHDWSIEGEFNPNHPAGTGGGALPGGTGWYRKTFTLPKADTGKQVYITFDGVYQNSEVFINGQSVGKRPNGYISFQYDLTPYLHFGTEPNTLAVKVDNSEQPNSRWYTGSGIYRNVWLEKMGRVHIDLWGTHVTTPNITESHARVDLAVDIINTIDETSNVDVVTIIRDRENNAVAKESTLVKIKPGKKIKVKQHFVIASPNLWSVENPYLYKAFNFVKRDNNIIDSYETTFGIRYFSFDSAKGFILNGNPVKIKGVCNHHDLGALGAALNVRAKERQLEILKEMGCNGIRTAHNPPSPELLGLCDRMGFIVMNETFDVWAKKKRTYDYAKFWDQWHKKDLRDHVLRDRNHPCIFSWSIGNEILEQWDSSGMRIARELTSIVNHYAPGIPVTAGCNGPDTNNFVIESGALDLIGFNYHHQKFEQFPEIFKNEKFIASETTSALASRGSYDMPSDSIRRWPYRWDEVFLDGNPDNTCSSYDNCSTPWGSTHIESWKIIKKHDFLSGMYIWTGFDYLGEPTPYRWPSRSSYFGIIDLAGFPKNAYYLYQSEWTNKDVLHIFPHWNWNQGDKVDVWAYTNCSEVELFLNDKSLGKQYNHDSVFHLQWATVFEPGEIRAVGMTKDGEILEKTVKTAGVPYQIQLKADRTTIKNDGKDLSFITATILDDQGVMVPYADNFIRFDVTGNANVIATDNGSQTSHESFQSAHRNAFNGKCLAIVKGMKGKEETVEVTATSNGLQTAKTTLTIKKE